MHNELGVKVWGDIPVSSLQLDLIAEILRRRIAQDRKWGPQSHSDIKWLGYVVEEIGEAAEEINSERDVATELDYEIVDIIATALAWLEDRRSWGIANMNPVYPPPPISLWDYIPPNGNPKITLRDIEKYFHPSVVAKEVAVG